MWRAAVAMVRREALGASRRRGALAGVVMLALTLLVVGEAAFAPGPEEIVGLLPGLVWMAGLLASGAGLARLWDAEGEPALRDALLATPADRAGLVLGKALWGGVVAMSTLLATLLSAWVLFTPRFPEPNWLGLLAVLALGGLGLGSLGALFGALTVGLPTRDLLLPLLLFPAVVPLLISGVALTAAALAGDAPDGAWLLLLVGYGALSTLLAAGLGEAALEA